METLIGSTALQAYLPDVRTPKDVDYFTTDESDLQKRKPGVEYFYHPKLKEYTFDSPASLDELYTIKVSHSYWEIRDSWNKHMFDIVKMRQHGAKLIQPLHDLLYSIWEERYGKKKVNLNQEPELFFNKNVARKYEHDTIHAAIAYYDEPLFNQILKDNHAVAVDRNKFFNLNEEMKHQLIREEIYATALERQLIPSNFEEHPRKAYLWALQKTITSFTKGWFTQYIVENFDKLAKPDLDYVAKFNANADKLKLIKQ